MEEQQEATDPYFQDWQPFDPSETELNLDEMLKGPPTMSGNFSSYLNPFPYEDLDIGEPLQDFDSNFPQLEYDNVQDFRFIGISPSIASEGIIGEPIGRTPSLAISSSNHTQRQLPSSAPELRAPFNDERWTLTLDQPTETNFSSVSSGSLSIPWSSSVASAHQSPKTNHKSPTNPDSVEFIQYTVDQTTKKMKKFDSNAENRKGRKGKLTEGQRRDAGRMRKVGACSSCRKRREKCDDGLYCRACVLYFKGDLIYHPCRDRWLDSLADVLLDGSLLWYPSARTLDDFLGAGRYQRSRQDFPVPISFSFGPSLNLRARLVNPEDSSHLLHKHVTSNFPPPKAGFTSCREETHLVFPAVLADASLDALKSMLDKHLGRLVDECFQDFPLYDSKLMVLRWIFAVYQHLEERTHRDLMQKTLKLLVLVHIGDVISVDPNFGLVKHCLHSFAVRYQGPGSPPSTVTPCFIRAQIGGVMKTLAKSMLKEILETLEPLSLSSRCSDWFVVLSVNSLLVMAMETVQYHGHRLGFHALQDFPPKSTEMQKSGPQRPLQSGSSTETCMTIESEGVDHLLKFYSACFGGCHSRLGTTSGVIGSAKRSRSVSLGSTSSSAASGVRSGRNSKQRFPSISNQQQDLADTFIKGLRDAIDSKRFYLETCKQRDFTTDDGRSKDPMWIFDRLLARLLLTES